MLVPGPGADMRGSLAVSGDADGVRKGARRGGAA